VRQVGIAFWDYLGSRLAISDQPIVQSLATLIRCGGRNAVKYLACCRLDRPNDLAMGRFHSLAQDQIDGRLPSASPARPGHDRVSDVD
jgi:hypothetical protein